VHDVLAALLEGVEADKESVGGDLPLVGTLGLALVLEIGILELRAGLESESQLVMSFLGLLILDAAENGLTIDIFAALADDGIADLTDENDKAGRGVVIGRIGPDHENHMHDGDKEVGDLSELLTQVSELVEQGSEGLQVLEVLVTFRAGSLDFLLELAERASVGGLVLLEELEDLLYALRVKLVADGVEVLRFVLPEVDLSQGIGVLVTLKGALGVLLEHILDLLSPSNDCA